MKSVFTFGKEREKEYETSWCCWLSAILGQKIFSSGSISFTRYNMGLLILTLPLNFKSEKNCQKKVIDKYASSRMILMVFVFVEYFRDRYVIIYPIV